MSLLRKVRTVESHTEGMPTRVVIDGIGEIPGNTMFEKRMNFMKSMDGIRQWLMFEDRKSTRLNSSH